MLTEKLKSHIDDDDSREVCLDLIKVVEEKYKTRNMTAAEKREAEEEWKLPGTHVKHPFTKADILERLKGKGGFGDAEGKRPWAQRRPVPRLLIRAWDASSKCVITDGRVGLLSGGSASRLDTDVARAINLRNHASWKNRHGTPFISTSSSIGEIEKIRIPHFENRQRIRGRTPDGLTKTNVTIINSRARQAAGRPITHMKEELLHYKIETKYGRIKPNMNSFYDHEWLLPFYCSADEIVGTWTWYEISKWMGRKKLTFRHWFRLVAIPAFRKHEAARQDKIKTPEESVVARAQAKSPTDGEAPITPASASNEDLESLAGTKQC